ncbi:neuroglian-like [Mytilus edulis]|uniref:neuroglian-like n=1 Tax=Mytilus edulis TaxID=6550 RepID=UPI0039EF5FFD
MGFTGLPNVSVPSKVFYSKRMSELIVPCSVNDLNPVLWRKLTETGFVVLSNHTFSTIAVGTSLMILSVAESEDGEYQCCSSNNYGTACDNFTIASGYVPTIQGRKEITAKINEKTILEVEFASKPVPYILSAYWQKDSQNISGERFTIVSVSDPKLTINNVVSDDDGIYTCIVFNGVGTASVDISLFTWSEPSVSLVWIDDITNITVIGTATSKPEVTHISWKRRVQSTTKPTDFSITTKYRISGTFSSPVLTIFDMQNDVRGTYIICTASNNFSTSYAEIYIPVRDIPFVSAAKTTYHMTIGSSNYLRCNFDSYPKATRLYWLKYPSDNKETLVYNTSITELAFLVQHATGEDAGNYSCCAANSLGYACSSYIALFIREEPKTPKIDTILIIFGIVIGILLVIAIIVVVLTKRRQEHTSQSHYEERDMSTDENHRYGNTRDRSVYYNSQEEVKVDAINTGYDYCWTEGMLERYDVSELKNNLQNKNFFQPRLTAEFRILASPIQEYDYIESDIQRGFGRPDDNRIITIQNGDNCLMISDISNLHNIENFWNIIYERQIENTILLAKKGEMIPELYPTLDDSIEIADLVIEMESAEKINHNIQLLTFKLYNKNTKSAIKIEIFKSYNSKYTDKYPDFDVLSCLVDKVSDRKGNVLLLGSKSFGLRISGVLYVCLDVAKAMKKEGIFNLLESAITAKRNISSVFQDFDEYEMCYTVTEYYLEHYLHHVDTYDYID